jgi:hypothetical protein
MHQFLSGGEPFISVEQHSLSSLIGGGFWCVMRFGEAHPSIVRQKI